jgi:pyruvate dehydrogenase E2 component (dihydrolipoamide acetyltransferase)
MSVSVQMPQLGESVTEGTVTRWLKHEGDHVNADEPLLEVSTDKVDTEIPSPVSGTLRGITVAEDETVAVGAELAIIDEDGAGDGAGPSAAAQAQPPPAAVAPAAVAPEPPPAAVPEQVAAESPAAVPPAVPPAFPSAVPPAFPSAREGYGQPYAEPDRPYQSPYAAPAPPPYQPEPYQPEPYQPQPYQPQPYPAEPSYSPPPEPPEPPEPPVYAETSGPPTAPPLAPPSDDGPYVTPLVRKLAAENGIDLGTLTGTGVGGRIRKQDVLEAARLRSAGGPPTAAPAQAYPAPPAAAPAAPAPEPQAAPAAPVAPPAPPAPPRAAPAAPAVPAARPVPAAGTVPAAASALRGTTERLSRPRQVIAQRMVESLQTSAQLTTVIEADVTAIARLRERTKAAFEAREGVKLSFLPFFALATVEALKAHPKLNAFIDTQNGTVTYHDAEHLGIAVDTERGLMVPVIRNAGDLNIGGLARKIADLAQRTRAGQVGPDELTGGTFTLTNTGSRGALFDTPIINQPQVGILGTGTVNRRAVVVDDPDLGEVITIRSVLYLSLTYDHRLVDGADAARFLVTIRGRLEQGAFEAEFGW